MGCYADRFFYNYMGSTTSPDCPEDVKWIIAREPLLLKPDSLQMI